MENLWVEIVRYISREVYSTPRLTEVINNGEFDRDIYKNVLRELKLMYIEGLVIKKKIGQTYYWANMQMRLTWLRYASKQTTTKGWTDDHPGKRKTDKRYSLHL